MTEGVPSSPNGVELNPEMAGVLDRLKAGASAEPQLSGPVQHVHDLETEAHAQFAERVGSEVEKVQVRAEEVYGQIREHEGILHPPDQPIPDDNLVVARAKTVDAIAHGDVQAALAEFRVAQTELSHAWYRSLMDTIRAGTENFQQVLPQLSRIQAAPLEQLPALLKGFVGDAARYDHSTVQNLILAALAHRAREIAFQPKEGKFALSAAEGYDPALELYLSLRKLTEEAGSGRVIDPLNAAGQEVGKLREQANYPIIFVVMEDPFFGLEDNSRIGTDYNRLVFMPNQLASNGKIKVTEPPSSISL